MVPRLTSSHGYHYSTPATLKVYSKAPSSNLFHRSLSSIVTHHAAQHPFNRRRPRVICRPAPMKAIANGAATSDVTPLGDDVTRRDGRGRRRSGRSRTDLAQSSRDVNSGNGRPVGTGHWDSITASCTTQRQFADLQTAIFKALPGLPEETCREKTRLMRQIIRIR